MVFIVSEKMAQKIAKKYRRVAIFSMAKEATAVTVGDTEVNYGKIGFLPAEDTINAMVSGDIKVNKVVKQMVKLIKSPRMDTDEEAAFGMNVTTMITMITNTRSRYDHRGNSVRKSERGNPTAIIFLKDEEDPQRSKVLTKYITGILKAYKLEAVTDDKKKGQKFIKALFKGKRSKIVERVRKWANDPDNKQVLTGKGLVRQRNNKLYFEMELQQTGMNGLNLKDLRGDTADIWAKTLRMIYTAENLKLVQSDKMGKKLAKKNEAAAKAYNILRKILKSMDPELDMPKVEYGQKKKGKGKNKRPVGPKMNVKKFKKFYSKRRNRGYILMIYAHTMAMTLGYLPGTSAYNKHMRQVCDNIRVGFGKEFTLAATAYAKGKEKPAETSDAKA